MKINIISDLKKNSYQSLHNNIINNHLNSRKNINSNKKQDSKQANDIVNIKMHKYYKKQIAKKKTNALPAYYVIYKIAAGYRKVSVSYELNEKGNFYQDVV